MRNCFREVKGKGAEKFAAAVKSPTEDIFLHTEEDSDEFATWLFSDFTCQHHVPSSLLQNTLRGILPKELASFRVFLKFDQGRARVFTV